MIEWTPFELATARPFGIARWTHSSYGRVRVQWTLDGLTGCGEAALNAFYGETPQTVLAVLPLLAEAAGTDPWAFRALAAGRPVRELLGLPAGPLPESSFTVGLGPVEEMAGAARAAVEWGHRILKGKLGTARDEAILEALRVDASAAWTRPQAQRMLGVLAVCGVELLEQPLAADDLEGHTQLRRRSPLPIIADESLHSVRSMGALAGSFDGVNLKLAKLGGPLQALRALELARDLHLGVMLGCMVESSLGIAAALPLAPLCDWADLDSPLLLAHNPCRGCAGRAVSWKGPLAPAGA